MSEDATLDKWLQPFHLSFDKICTLTAQLAATYKHLALHSDEQFLATPVTKLPGGDERGEFLAIDFGGSNLRVAFVNLLGRRPASGRRPSLDAYDERIEKYHEQSWPIGDHLKVEKAEDLFAWIGSCLAAVIQARMEDGEGGLPDEIPLGLAFSFPVLQSSLSEATLMPMGKGFSITSNPDLGSMVLEGYEKYRNILKRDGVSTKQRLPGIKLVAIANDAVATLMSLSYTAHARRNSKAVIGLIMGTGCNAAIPMKPQDLQEAKVQYATNGRQVEEIVVNTECTLRGVGATLHGLGLFTKWDVAIDQALPTPGFQPFEYLCAGAYLGEIVRQIVYDHFTNEMAIKEGQLPKNLVQRNGLTTTFLCNKVATTDDSHALAADLNKNTELGTTSGFTWTPFLAAALLRTERAVVRRSVTLIAAAIVALLVSTREVTLKQQGQESQNDQQDASSFSNKPVRELVVAYCGGLICLYPSYRKQVRVVIDQLLEAIVAEKGTVVTLREASAGGVIGAGVLAGTVWPC